MASLGDMLGSFTGGTQKKYANQAYESSTRELQQGRDKSIDAYGQGYSQAQGYLTPYSQQGRQANKIYGTYLGLDGADAQRGAMQQYAGADPFRAYNEQQANQGMARQYNRMGLMGSGNMALGMGRASLERGSQDYNNYLGRLAGLGQQGMGAAGQLGQYAMQHGQGVAGAWNGYGNAQAGNEIQRANALGQASGILGNNLMKLGGLAISAYTGMPVNPGGGGMSGSGQAFGQAGGGGRGGANWWG